MNKLSAWLEKESTARGWSYREAAEKCGMRSHNTIAKIAAGEQRPSPATCKQIAQGFGVTQEYILYLAGHLDYNPSAELKPEVAYIVRFLSSIEDEEALTVALEAVKAVLVAIVGPVGRADHDANSSAA